MTHSATPARIRVLIVDHSAFVRQFLTQVLAQDPAIEVVGAAADVDIAWRKIEALQPDVLTLDIAMPQTDGLAFLTQLMRVHPMPVVMLSALTEPGGEITRRALEIGASNFVTKPRCDVRTRLIEVTTDLRDKIVAAARLSSTLGTQRLPLDVHDLVVAVGVSTGGPQALHRLLQSLPAYTPGIVIVQHMPEHYTRGFAERLNDGCMLRVRQAADGDQIASGTVLVAPGDRHLQVVRDGAHLRVRVVNSPAVNHHRPSVDVLFHSVATHAGANAIGIILTGMGADGAAGLLAMKRAGACTIAQDEATSVVFGMPKEAIGLGAVDRIVPLDRIGSEIGAWHVRRRPDSRKEMHGQDSDCR
jgi:two-component system chemotaxis response regulator CheB